MTRERVRQALCGLRGHNRLLHMGEHWLTLRCASCGHDTPGWELNATPPTLTVRGDPRRHQILRLKIAARQIA